MGTIICRHDRLRRQCDECDMSEEIAQLRADLARVTAERDARPEISREDAATFTHWNHDLVRPDVRQCVNRIERALRAHAAGSGKGWDDA